MTRCAISKFSIEKSGKIFVNFHAFSFTEVPTIVLEFMLLGDLRSFLRSKRVEKDNEHIYVNSHVIESGLNADDFIRINLDVAKGLEYLSKKRVRDGCSSVASSALCKVKWIMIYSKTSDFLSVKIW